MRRAAAPRRGGGGGGRCRGPRRGARGRAGGARRAAAPHQAKAATAKGRKLREEAEATATKGRVTAEGGAQALHTEIARLHKELVSGAVARLWASQAEESARVLEAERDKVQAGHIAIRIVAQRRASGQG